MSARKSDSGEAFMSVSLALDNERELQENQAYQTPGLSASHCMAR